MNRGDIDNTLSLPLFNNILGSYLRAEKHTVDIHSKNLLPLYKRYINKYRFGHGLSIINQHINLPDAE